MTDILQEAKDRFADCLEWYSDEYSRGEEDVDFLFDQWDETDRKARKTAGRPCLQENLLVPFVDQVVNAAREMRPSIKVSPVDDQADPETAKVIKGLIRNIERQSKADIAYDTGVRNAVQSGYGWIRVNTQYSEPLSFDQEARIECVPDWKSCMLDPSSVEPDGSDAEYGFMYSDIDDDTYESLYPDADKVDFDSGDWKADKTTRIAEYFYKEYTSVKISECFLRDGTVTVLTEAQKEELGEYIVKVLRERTAKTHVVKWCKFSGAEELESTEWLGMYIPIVPVYGRLCWKDGRQKSYSLITNGKDPSKLHNIILTTMGEMVSSQPKTQPYIGAIGQFNTYGDDWTNANRDNPAFLEYDPVFVTDEVTGQSALAPPPMKSPPMQISPALFQMKQDAAFGINMALGMHEENRGEESNAISGVAVRSRQVRGDRATFHFIDNLAASIRHVGVILVDLIPHLYTQKTVARILGEDGKEENVTIDPRFQNKPDKAANIYNPGLGKYDVDVDVGPSYATQQQEFLDLSKELLRANPDYAAVAGDKLVEAAGGPYADVIAERIRANMPPELQSDDPMAAKLLQVAERLKQAEDQNLTLLAQLDKKQKDEAFANQIDMEEVKIKQQDSDTKRLEALAKVAEMKEKAKGAESEALADIADAIMDLGAMVQDQNNTISLILDQAEGANGQPT